MAALALRRLAPAYARRPSPPPLAAPKPARVASFYSGANKGVFTVDNIQAAIEGIAEMVTGALQKVAPDKAAIEFGLEVGPESGNVTALWVKGTGKANLKIKLEWTRASSGVR
jgi:hypothetical protein